MRAYRARMSADSFSEPVRWGVLGAANNAIKTAVPAMQNNDRCRVVAIASRDLAKAKTAADALKIPRAYGSYQELIADPEIEAIYNPLPNHLHVPWTLRAAEAGKHVLCEKPIALTSHEALALVDAREKYGVQIAEAFMVRTHPQWLAVKEIVKSGEIGELRLITGHFSYFKRDPFDVRSIPEWGGGALMDIGCYPITMSRWLFDEEPIEVAGQLEFDPDMHIDRVGSALLRFPSGQATVTFAGQVALNQRLQIFGTKGHITIEVPFNPPPNSETSIIVDDARDLTGGGARVVKFAAVNQYTIQAERFSDAVRGRGSVAVSLEDAIGNMRVIDAVFRAAKSHRWESVSAKDSVGENNV